MNELWEANHYISHNPTKSAPKDTAVLLFLSMSVSVTYSSIVIPKFSHAGWFVAVITNYAQLSKTFPESAYALPTLSLSLLVQK
jgi:hypothetical protein